MPTKNKAQASEIQGDHPSPRDQARELLAAGYEPIPVLGKRPAAGLDWQDAPVTEDRLKVQFEARPDACNIGLRTGRLVGVDIDVEDPAEAERVMALVEAELGETPYVRVGKKGMLLCYRNPEPARKITVASPDKTKVEILGQGQQFVAYGVHPETGQPYRWTTGTEPSLMPFDVLPAVTTDQLRALAPKLQAALGEAHPGVKVSGDMGQRDRGQVVEFPPKRDLPAFPPEEIRERLFCCDPDLPRDEWRDLIAAVRATPCTDPDFDARELVQEWSATTKVDYGDDPAEAAGQVFDTMPPRPDGRGAGSFVKTTDAAGYSGPTVAHAPRQSKPILETFPILREWGVTEAVVAKPARNRFTPLFPADMRKLPDPTYTVETLIPDEAVVVVFGQPRSLKTFLVLDVLASTAAGLPAFGKFVTRPGATFLCAGEAPRAVARKRWPAWARARGIADPDAVPLGLVPGVPRVVAESDVTELIDAIKASGKEPRIIAIDTVARAMAGLDENSAKDMGLLVAAAERIRDEFHCSVILIHHSGKDQQRGARGSNALEGGSDAEIEVIRPEEKGLTVNLRFGKMKDADEPNDIWLHGEEVGGSLVFNAVEKDELMRSEGKPVGTVASEVEAALTAAGATEEANRTMYTRALAVAILGPGATEAQIKSQCSKLNRDAKGKLKRYLRHKGAGGDDPSLWWVPAGVSD